LNGCSLGAATDCLGGAGGWSAAGWCWHSVLLAAGRPGWAW